MVTVIVISACREQNVENVNSSKLYPELKIGQVKEFAIKQSTWVIDKKNEESYFIKDVVSDTVNFGEELYFIKLRYRRNSDLETWKYMETIFEYHNERGVFEKSDNTHVQKVGFPVDFSTTWKIDQRLVSIKNNTALYLDFKVPYSFNNENWNDGYSIQIKKDSSGIQNILEIENYSPKYGLIFSNKKTILYCQESKDCLGKSIEESKTIISKTLVKTNL